MKEEKEKAGRICYAFNHMVYLYSNNNNNNNSTHNKVADNKNAILKNPQATTTTTTTIERLRNVAWNSAATYSSLAAKGAGNPLDVVAVVVVTFF